MKLRTLAGLVLVLVAFAIVGMADKQTLDEEQAEYCNNVKDGLWPDFHGSYQAECVKKKAGKFNGTLTQK